MITAHKHTEKILKLNSKFFIDIGCSDASSESQSEFLLDHGWSGLMFEYDETKFKNQQSRMSGRNVKVINEKVTPDNILDLLKSNNVPLDFYLSLDIDGYDYFVLEKILSEYKPSFIVSEINEKIPPNIKFSVSYHPEYWWDVSHFYGYSISMIEDLLEKNELKILELDYNNVILVKGVQEESIVDIYNSGYLHKSDRKDRFSYNQDFEEIYDLPKNLQIDFINSKFEKHKGKFIIS